MGIKRIKCKPDKFRTHNAGCPNITEQIRLQTQLEFLQQKLFGDGKDSISARLTRIEDMLYKLNHEQGVVTGKVAIIAAVISVVIGLALKLGIK